MRNCSRLSLSLSTILIVVLGLAACGGDSDEETTVSDSGSIQAPAGKGGEREAEDGSGTEAESDSGRSAGEAGGGPSTGSGEDGSGGSTGGTAAIAPPRAPGQRTLPSGAVQSLPPSSADQEQAIENTYGSIREFGSEPGSAAETTAITGALQGYLAARAAADWAAACSLLTERLLPGIAGYASLVKGDPDPGCPEILAEMMKDVPRDILARQAQIDVAGVRVEGERAFVIYSTPESISVDMPMYLEDGGWKVGALEAYALK